MEQQTTTMASANLSSAIDEIFGETKTSLELRDGTLVTFKPAKLPQTAIIIEFFEMVTASADPDQLFNLLKEIADAQSVALSEGRSHTDIKINAIESIRIALGQKSLILGLFAKTIRFLPKVVSEFTNLSVEKLEDLDLDEMTAVSVGVLAVNYSFFTQALPPILRSVIKGWRQKGEETKKLNEKTQSASSRKTVG